MEGKLELLDKVQNKWSEKFCIVDDESFCICNSVEDFEDDNILGEIHLEILNI